MQSLIKASILWNDLTDNTTGDQIVTRALQPLILPAHSCAFGYVVEGKVSWKDGRIKRMACEGDYVNISHGEPCTIDVNGEALFIIRRHLKGYNLIGKVDTEGPGFVNYIDGCTDSLIVPPPRLGDPCVNILYFPPAVNQSFHTHPSFRAGIVIGGRGTACVNQEEIPLNPGDVFYLPTNTNHRFKTDLNPMTIYAYHPDTDWGPTDENHPMINRTII